MNSDIDERYREIHQLQKIIHGADVPYWLNEWTLFEYPPKVIKGWEQKLDQLLDLDLQQRPHILRNERWSS